jgi:hypothetical protein
VDGNLVVAWQEPEVKALIAEAVRESAEGPEIIARYDEMAEANEPAFMANVSLVFVGMKLKREGMLAYKKSRWMHIRPGGLVCWSSPLECRRYEQDSQPLTGDEAQEGFDAFRSVLVANRIPEFCADMDAEVDEIFAEYEAKVARCGGGNWPSMKEYCASALAVLREFN